MAVSGPGSNNPGIKDELLIVQLLRKKGILTDIIFDDLQKKQAKLDASPEELIASTDKISDRDVAEAYADYLGIPIFSPLKQQKDAPDMIKVVRVIPERLARSKFILPFRKEDNVLEVAFATLQIFH